MTHGEVLYLTRDITELPRLVPYPSRYVRRSASASLAGSRPLTRAM